MRDYYWLYYAAMLFAAVAQRSPYIAFGFLVLTLLLLAYVRAERGDAKGAAEARKRARKTWSELPGFMRRRQFSLWLRSLI